MGLFDFMKSSKKKSEDDQKTAAELQKAVEAMNLGIKNLAVSFAGETATISGIAPSQKDLEIARLVVGNHEGVEKVNDDGLKVELPVGATAGPMTAAGRMYTVKSGDTLSKIAQAEWGDATKYPALFEANKPMLKDPNKIYPGQVLRVPPVTSLS